MKGGVRKRASERRRVALRSALLQSLWNYETLQGVGFAWALLPGLARLYPDPSIRRGRLLSHLELFNSNPYLATIAMGVVLRLEREVARGVAGAEGRVRRLVSALGGTLGALGDDLFWAGWRPALGAAAATATLASGSWWRPILPPGGSTTNMAERIAGILSRTEQVFGHARTADGRHDGRYHLIGYCRHPPFSNELYPGSSTAGGR